MSFKIHKMKRILKKVTEPLQKTDHVQEANPIVPLEVALFLPIITTLASSSRAYWPLNGTLFMESTVPLDFFIHNIFLRQPILAGYSAMRNIQLQSGCHFPKWGRCEKLSPILGVYCRAFRILF